MSKIEDEIRNSKCDRCCEQTTIYNTGGPGYSGYKLCWSCIKLVLAGA